MIPAGASGAAAELLFSLVDSSSGAGKTSHVWNDVGGGLTNELKIQLPSAAGVYGNAIIARIVERGGGTYGYQLAASETAVAGPVLFYPNVVGHDGSALTASWERIVTTEPVPTAAAVAGAVWDEPRAGHAASGTFGEGVNVVMIADGILTAAKFAADAITATVLSSSAANKVRDAVFSNTHYAGRTFMGFVRRMDQMIIGRHSGMRSALWQLFAPNGSVLVSATQDPSTGTREAASTVAGDE